MRSVVLMLAGQPRCRRRPCGACAAIRHHLVQEVQRDGPLLPLLRQGAKCTMLVLLGARGEGRGRGVCVLVCGCGGGGGVGTA